jgi:pimeloyl-ACP methyl ester carboxylesterase
MAFQVPVDPRAERRARNVGWATTILSAVLIGLIAYLAYAGFQGSDQLVHPERSRDCRLPTALGMAYEAINYDITSDAALAAEPDPASCTAEGQPAGTALVTSDGVRIAGWYIPAAAPIGPTGPTVVIVHGHASNKNRMLPIAQVLHPSYNLVLYDARNHGQSFGDETTSGVNERLDLEAVVGWLQASHAPTWTAVLGVSMGGIVGTYAVARGLPVQALVIDSTPVTLSDGIQRRIERMGYPLALPASWAVMLGTLFRTGVDISAADPISVIDALGGVPLLIIQGSSDVAISPDAGERLAAEAQSGNVQAELQVCPGAGHGLSWEVCPDDYQSWVLGFLARTQAP